MVYVQLALTRPLGRAREIFTADAIQWPCSVETDALLCRPNIEKNSFTECDGRHPSDEGDLSASATSVVPIDREG
jgi:hypothetical protein